GKLIAFIKNINSDIICMVDNCYGEFVDIIEPTEVGADLIVGSLIKNPGGGLAPIGGYIVGKEEYVENAAARLTSPGLGKEVGATLGVTPMFFQGLFNAPQVVGGSVKGAVFLSKLFEGLGFNVLPTSTEKRADIVQCIQLKTPENVIAFGEGIQKGAPVDSFVTPEPWAMPGYDWPVIMAAGAFVQGSSIELSADAPMKPPYNVFFQGGLSWHHAKIGIVIGLQNMVDKGLIKL
ncbi:MAG: methionine gamma-lyase family protein, partial [Anaerotignaceae bacterium]